MITVAIVEDQEKEAKRLQDFIHRYHEESGEEFQVTHYPDALVFLDGYAGVDLVFMDIEMPYMNGMESSLRLREKDKQAVLIFVTNMAQYAVKGYEADAFDFIVKPVVYADFSFKMKRALAAVEMRRPREVTIASREGFVRIRAEELLYVEVRGHDLTWHQSGGKNISVRGKISEVESRLESFGFLRCHNSFLVNPRHIESVAGYVLKIGGEELPISHPRKKEFLEKLTRFYGEGGI